jgi:hypothetical protein
MGMPAMSERTCRVCGCDEHRACTDPEHGACWWVEPDLCSHCGEPAIVAAEFDMLFGDTKKLSPMGILLFTGRLIYLQQWALKARAALGRASKIDPSEFEPFPHE